MQKTSVSARASSSVGKSTGFLIRRSGVRIPPGVPDEKGSGIKHAATLVVFTAVRCQCVGLTGSDTRGRVGTQRARKLDTKLTQNRGAVAREKFCQDPMV